MNAVSTAPSAPGENECHVLCGVQSLFYAHVGALVLTAVVVVPLLLGVASIPPQVSAAYCFFIAALAAGFVVYATLAIRHDRELSVSQRIEYLLVFLGLSSAQAVFILPVLLCVHVPGLRL